MNETLPYTALVQLLEQQKHNMLGSVLLDEQVNEITTSEYQTGSYRVFVTNSAYVADIVVTLANYYLFLTFLDKTNVVLGLRHRVDEAPENLQATIDHKMLDSIRQSMATGFDAGRYPQNRGKTYTVWNFHSNLIYASK